MESRKDTVLRLRKEGKKYKEIAEILQFSLSLVSYYLTHDKTLRKFKVKRASNGFKQPVRDKEKSSIATQKIKNRNRQIVTDYLSTHPCVDCGITDIRVLQFDHVRGTKINSVSVGVRDSWAVEKLQAEIEKCEIRCANCHKIMTDTRRLETNNKN